MPSEEKSLEEKMKKLGAFMHRAAKERRGVTQEQLNKITAKLPEKAPEKEHKRERSR